MPKKVLIVDDAMFMRRMIKDILTDSGDFVVVGEAANGVEAMELYQELHPELVTMDITMPRMDGINAVRLIKKYDPDARIVMITALGQEKKVKESIVAGARGFIIKPLERERVLSAAMKAVQ